MKKTSSRILAFAVTVALLASLIVGILPVAAAAASSVTATASTKTISSLATYTFTFDPTSALANPPAATTTVAAATGFAVTGGSTFTFTVGDTFTFTNLDSSVRVNAALPVSVAAGGTLTVVAGDQVKFTATNTLTTSALGGTTYYNQMPPTGIFSPAVGTVIVKFPAAYTLNQIIDETTVTACYDATLPLTSAFPADGAIAVNHVAVNNTTNEVAIATSGWLSNPGQRITVIFTGITNPGVLGDQIISVKSAVDSTYGDAAAITITAAVVPGTMSIYNSSGNFLGVGTFGAAADTINLLPAGVLTLAEGYKITLTPASYAVTAGFSIAANNIQIVPTTGSNADTILTGTLTVTGNGFTATNIKTGTLTLNGKNAVVTNCVTGTVNIGGTGVTVTNCTIPATVNISNTGFSFTNNTVDLTGILAPVNGVVLNNVAVVAGTLSGNTFKVNQNTTTFVPDVAISATAAVTGVNITNNTFTGSTGGVGYFDAAGAGTVLLPISITKNTFTSLERAVDIGAASVVNISNNTIDKTITNNASNSSTFGAINISGVVAPTIAISGNIISSSAWFSVNITGVPVGGINATGNSFRANVKGFNNAGVGTVSAVQNWWGDVTGPKNATANPAGIGDPVSNSPSVLFTPFMTAVPTAGQSVSTAAAGALAADFSLTSGINVLGFTAPAGGATIGTQKLSSNPKSVTLPFPVLSGGYFDVYTSAASTTNFQIKFYVSGVNKDTEVYYWSNLSNSWVVASDQGVSGTVDYAFVNVTATTSPTFTDFQGTAFALVMGPASTPAPFGIAAPSIGSNQGLTNVSFTWASVAGATSYEFIMDDSSAFSTPFVVDQKSLLLPVYQYTGANLTAGTTYFWRVIAYQGNTVLANSQVGYFMAAAPATVAPPVTVITTSFVPTTVISVPPAVTVTPTVITSTVVTVPPAVTTVFTTQPITITTITAPQATIINPTPTYTTITIPPTPTVPSITPAWIWGVIGIGAILIIVVIVLIVRTRRSV